MEKAHNLEVPGSSPGWSTLRISNLEEIQVAGFSFCENNAKTNCFSLHFCVTDSHGVSVELTNE